MRRLSGAKSLLSLAMVSVMVLTSVSCAGTPQAAPQATAAAPQAAPQATGAVPQAAPQATVGTAYIGVVMSLTGVTGDLGLAITRGLEMAVGEINDAGGFKVGGKPYKLELLKADSQGKGDQAVAMATKMVSEGNRPPVIFGPPTSGDAAPMAELRKSRNDFIMMAAATVVGTYLTEGGLVFHLNPPLEWVAPDFQDYAVDKLGIKTAAVLLPDSDIGRSIGDKEAQPQFQRRGVKITDVLYYPTDTKDFSTFLTRIKPNKPDLLYQGTDNTATQSIIRQALELGLTKNVMNRGGNLAGGEPFKDQLDNYITEVVFDVDYSKASSIVAWKDRFQKRFGRVADNAHSDGLAFLDYDEVFLLAKAMEKAGTVTDPQAIAKALREVEHDGARGKLKYDSLGRSLKVIEAAHVRKGGDISIFPLVPKPDMVPKR